MTSIADICSSICALVKSIGEAAWEFDNDCGLLEEARKLHRYLRRVEVLVLDVQPYLLGVRVWGILREIEGTLASVLNILLDAGRKGRLVRYLQADRILEHFSECVVRLQAALASLEDEACGNGGTLRSGTRSQGYACSGEAGRDVVLPKVLAELRVVRVLLQSARFDLPAAHMANLQRFRTSCDSLHVHFQAMMLSYDEMMAHTGQERLLSQKCFREVIHELQTDVEVQQQALQSAQAAALSHGCTSARGERGCAHRPVQQDAVPQAQQCAAEQHYLRMLMDVVRASHLNTDCEAPLHFLCPLTHQLMQDPVLLHETGHSYERNALEEWWASGHRFCPRTGLHLRRLNTSPNHNLRSAIESWSLHSDLHLSFKPALATLVAQRQAQQREAVSHQEQQGEAECREAADREKGYAGSLTQVPEGEGLRSKDDRNGGEGYQPCSCDAGRLCDSAFRATEQAQPADCARAAMNALELAGDMPSSADAVAETRAMIHGPQQVPDSSEGCPLCVGGRLAESSVSSAFSDGTEHCMPCFDTSQHSSSTEQLDRLTLWSSDYANADFRGLGLARSCSATDAGSCSAATTSEGSTNCAADLRTSRTGLESRVQLGCPPTRVGVVPASRTQDPY